MFLTRVILQLSIFPYIFSTLTAIIPPSGDLHSQVIEPLLQTSSHGREQLSQNSPRVFNSVDFYSLIIASPFPADRSRNFYHGRKAEEVRIR